MLERGNKYGAKRTEIQGRSFMSGGEADCFRWLELREKSGEIKNLQTQVSVRLTKAELRWVLDFTWEDPRTGETIFADFKGAITERWRILEKLWPHYGPGRLQVISGSGMRMRVAKEIIPTVSMAP
jgi:hypothetical protein